MTSYIATLILSGLIGLFFGYMIWSPDPVKRTVEELNEVDALRAALRMSDAKASKLGHGIISIRNHFAGQKSGTAQKAVRMAQEALK
jgi:hypothetical protein